MGLTVSAEPVPLQADPDGVVRVGGTRVTFDTVIDVFNRGATPEEIVQQYPSLSLADLDLSREDFAGVTHLGS